MNKWRGNRLTGNTLYRIPLATMALVAGIYSYGVAAAPPKPNIVIMVADDLGWADVGYKGSPIETPNLDRLAGEGMELSRFYTTPSCSPTRAALMTGRNAFRLGIAYATIMPWSNNGVHPQELFMSQAFKNAGYQTAMFGKWHLGHAQDTYHPNQRGFDHFYGHLHTEVGFYPPFSNQGGKDFQRNGVSIDDHTPLDAPREFKDKYRGLEDTRGPARSPVDRISELARKFGRAKSQRPIYTAVVDAMDYAIGERLWIG